MRQTAGRGDALGAAEAVAVAAPQPARMAVEVGPRAEGVVVQGPEAPFWQQLFDSWPPSGFPLPPGAAYLRVVGAEALDDGAQVLRGAP